MPNLAEGTDAEVPLKSVALAYLEESFPSLWNRNNGHGHLAFVAGELPTGPVLRVEGSLVISPSALPSCRGRPLRKAD